MVRRAAFAGSWYPGKPGELRRAVEGYLAAGGPRSPALGLIAPHAGYVYSGAVAGAGYAAVEVTPTVVGPAPPHRRAGGPVAGWEGGPWRTPLGEVEVDDELARALVDGCADAAFDNVPHVDEHSLELQLPFLQVSRADVRIVPVAVATREAGTLARLGSALARAIAARRAEDGKDAHGILVVASSDMTHYEPADVARQKDDLALARVREIDPDGLLEVVDREGITMCGVAPAAAMLYAARELGAARAARVRYATSGDGTGEASSVVGYAAVAVRQS